MRELGHESLRHRLVDDKTLRRHADLPLIHEAPEGGCLHGFIEVGIVQHDKRRLAAQFQQGGLQVASRGLADDLADARRSGEIHAPHRRMGDQRIDDLRRVGRRVCDHIDDARCQAGVVQHLPDQAVRGRADLGGLENNRVAAGQWHGDRADAENDRTIPRRNAQNDTSRLANGQRQGSRFVGWNHFAGDVRGHRGRFAQNVRREVRIEFGPTGGSAGFLCHHRCEILGPRFQQIGCQHQFCASLAGADGGPCGKGRGGGHCRRVHVRDGCCWRARRDLAGNRIVPLEDGGIRGVYIQTINQHFDIEHDTSRNGS